ncbi:hypothetical protein LAZ40_02435 [Cereibacter sphaeroides]|uniref:beta strand repeat-containing protein n=1 Tax=Cereibacter sphaeroides TaxID=1063 RepID=UPI001F319E43|nr:hypothetical protein [Cereibacter sphaeroides]MCE6957916.1 hypothetical protein [Cereibacter sphaeroides]MCE6971736.1 hypothetical protein [Cereibacter sphaeroides]
MRRLFLASVLLAVSLPTLAASSMTSLSGRASDFAVDPGPLASDGGPSASDSGPFAFDSVDNAEANSLIASSGVTVDGIARATAVTVTGEGDPEISTDGWTWSKNLTLEDGQTLAVRLTSAPDNDGSSRVATVNVGGRAAAFTVTTADRFPDSFAFTAKNDVGLSEEVRSDTVTIFGLSSPAPVTASNGATVSINGAAFGASGTISEGQTLAVALDSAATEKTATSTEISVGGMVRTFTVTTGDGTPENFAFAAKQNQPGGEQISSEEVAISGLTLPAMVSVAGEGDPEVSIDGTLWAPGGTVVNGESLAVRLTSATGSDGGSRTATVTVGGLSAPFAVTTVDTTPAAFAFIPRTGLALAAEARSGEVTLGGITAPAPVEVTGGEVSIDGGAWASSGEIENGQTLEVRLVTSDQILTSSKATVSVGGRAADFVVTTGSNVPKAFGFPSVTNAAGGSLVTSAVQAIRGPSLQATVSVTGDGSPEVSVAGGPWTTSTDILDGQTLAVRLTAAAGSAGDRHIATVNVGGALADFAVTTVDTAPEPFSFSARRDVGLSEVIVSDDATIHGISAPAVVDVSGGEISIAGKAWATSGTIVNGQSLAVRVTSAAGMSTSKSAIVTVGGVTAPFAVTTGTTAPDAFAFQDVTNAPGGSLVSSATVSLSGFSLPSPVSVAGPGSPQISIDGGAWATSGTIVSGQTLAVRQTAVPGTNGGSRAATVTVGGVAATFTVVTADTTPVPYSFSARTGVALSTLTTSDEVTITGITAPTPVSIIGGEFSVAGSAWTTSGMISNGQTLVVRLTSPATVSTLTDATVTVGGILSTFSVTTGTHVPNAFGFPAVANATGSSLVTSETQTITGPSLPAVVSVSGDGNPQVSLNGGPWTTSGNILSGDTLAVRLTAAPGTSGGNSVATVNIGGATSDFLVSTIDTTPEVFVFASRTDVERSTLTSSSTTVLSGLSAPAPVSVDGGEISVAGGAWSTSGTISNGQGLAVRLTSAPGVSTRRSATVTVGGVGATFDVVTGTDVPDAFAFATATNVAGGSEVTSEVTTIGGITLPATVTVSGPGNPQVSIAGGAFGPGGTIANGQTLQVRQTAAAGTAGGDRVATVNVSGITGTFTVRTIDTTPDPFDLADKPNASLSSVTVTSVPILGLTAPAAVLVTGDATAEISTDGVNWETTDSISNNETLSVRLTSAATESTTKQAVVTVGGVSSTFTVTTLDTTPDAFNFADKSGAVPSSRTSWAPVTITGLTSAAYISVSGSGSPQFSLDNGATWKTSGTITNNTPVIVAITNPATELTATSATLKIGSVSDTFTVTTRNSIAGALGFVSVSNQLLDTLVTSNTVSISGLASSSTISVTGSGAPLLSINEGPWVTTGTVSNGNTVKLQLRTSGEPLTTVSAVANLGGVSSAFSATTGDNTPDAFTFPSKIDQPGGTTIYSDPVIMSGMTIPEPVIITNTSGYGVLIDGMPAESLGTVTRGEAFGPISNGQELVVFERSPSGSNSGVTNGKVTIGGRSAIFTVWTIDSTPDGFTFVPAVAGSGQSMTSNEVTVAGLGTSVPVSVTGTGNPKLVISGGSPVTSGMISNGKTLKVVMTAPTVSGQRNTATITLGSISTAWSVQYGGAAPAIPSYASQMNVLTNTQITSEAVTVSGLPAGARPVSVNGAGSPSIRIGTGSWVKSGTITNDQTLQVRLWSPGNSSITAAAFVVIDGHGTYFHTKTGVVSPSAFSFTPVTNATGGVYIESAPVTLTGNTLPVPVTVSAGSGSVSVDGGAWITTGSAPPGSTIKARVMSEPGTNGGTSSTIVYVGGSSGSTFKVTTIDTTPDAYVFPTKTGASLNVATASDPIPIKGITAPAPVTVSGTGTPQFSIDGGAWTTSGTITNGQTLSVRMTSPNLNATSRTIQVTVGGVTSSFTLTTS